MPQAAAAGLGRALYLRARLPPDAADLAGVGHLVLQSAGLAIHLRARLCARPRRMPASARWVRRYIVWMRILALPIVISCHAGRAVRLAVRIRPTCRSRKLFFMLDKTYATPLRLIAVPVAGGGIFARLPLYPLAAPTLPYARYVVDPLIRMLAMLGRNSLYVFCVGSLLSLTGQVIRFFYRGTVGVDTAVVISGIIIMAFTAWLAELRQRARPASPTPLA